MLKRIGLLLLALLALPLQAYELLMVSSYHPGFPWTQGCELGIEATLSGEYRIERRYLDSKRQPLQHVLGAEEQIWDEIKASPPDLVVLGDDNALRLLGPKLAQTEIPVVYYGVNQNPRHYFPEGGLPRNLTGVLERMPLKQSFRYFSKLLPGAKRALVLFDLSQTSRALIEQNFSKMSPAWIVGIETDFLVLSDWQEWQQAIQSAGHYDFILLSTFFALRDEALGPISAREAVRWSSEHSSVPLFSSLPVGVFDDGALGAVALEAVRHGQLAASLIRKILEQKLPPNAIQPLMDRNGLLLLNPAQMKRFDLDVPERLQPSVIYQ